MIANTEYIKVLSDDGYGRNLHYVNCTGFERIDEHPFIMQQEEFENDFY